MSIWQERSPSTRGPARKARRKRQQAIQNEDDCGAFSHQMTSDPICQRVSSNNDSNALPNDTKEESKIEGDIGREGELQMDIEGSDHMNINNELQMEDEDDTSIALFDENFDCSEDLTERMGDFENGISLPFSTAIPTTEPSPALQTVSEIVDLDIDA